MGVLATLRRRPVWSQLPLGFAAGIPLFLSGSTLSKWLADSNVDIRTVGLTALIALPYNFKFLWAPLLDRWAPPFLGRRRGWIAVFGVAVAIAIAVASQFDPSKEVQALAMAALAMATLSASLDVVVDAYRSDILAEDQRGSGTAMYLIGYRGALLVSGSVALLAADRIGWQATYAGLAALMLFGSLGVLLAPATRPPPSTRESLAASFALPLREFFGRSGAFWLIAFVALFRLGDGFVDQLLLPFLGERGYSNDEIGTVQKGMGLAATIVGVGIGGVLTDKLGVLRALLWFGILQAGANVGYLALALTGHDLTALIVAVGVDNICNGFGFAALVAFLMAACNRRFSATQYALLTSASSLLGKLLGASSGYVQAQFGWVVLFAISIAAAAPALLIVTLRRKAIEEALPPSSPKRQASEPETP